MRYASYILPAIWIASLPCLGALAQEPFDMSVPGVRTNGEIESFLEQTASVWTVSVKADGGRRRGTRVEVKKVQSVETHSYDYDGREVEYCRYSPLTAGIATIELGANSSAPTVEGDSIDMTVPAARILLRYTEDGTCVRSRWERILGIETFIKTDTIEPAHDSHEHKTEFVDKDGLKTHYVYNRQGDIIKMERYYNDGTMTVTVYDDYTYDVYGNWTGRKRYAIDPDGHRHLSGCSTRHYRYR